MQLAVKANKQQDREQASEEEQVDLGIDSLRLKSCGKKVIRQLMSREKKLKNQKELSTSPKNIDGQMLSQIVESVLTPPLNTTQHH